MKLRDEVVSAFLIESCCMKQPDAVGFVVVLHNHWCLVSLRYKDWTTGIYSNKDRTLAIDSNIKCWRLEAEHSEVDIHRLLSRGFWIRISNLQRTFHRNRMRLRSAVDIHWMRSVSFPHLTMDWARLNIAEDYYFYS